jgi:hypothetical protein
VEIRNVREAEEEEEEASVVIPPRLLDLFRFTFTTVVLSSISLFSGSSGSLKATVFGFLFIFTGSL